MSELEDSPNVQWFEAFPRCRCGKPSAGILRGTRNESYGHHCERCAEKRIAAAKRVRNAIAKSTTGGKP